jgi:hypothetical protein
MIVRLWHGRVPAPKAPAYRAFLNARAIPDYRSVPGNVSVHVLERQEGDVAHFITMTFWESVAAIRSFAGDDIEKAKYYPEDADFLLEYEPGVVHYEVAGHAQGGVPVDAAPADVSEITAVLARTPAALRALLEDLPEAWVEADEGDGTFSPRDVVGHLIHGEKTDWVPRIRLILEAGESRPFVPFDRFGFREAIRGVPTTSLLAELASLRTANLAFLAGLALTPGQLALKGRHPELGTVTLGQLLATWAVHDLNHLGQVVRVMSRRYADAVGPWKAYLGILKG